MLYISCKNLFSFNNKFLIVVIEGHESVPFGNAWMGLPFTFRRHCCRRQYYQALSSPSGRKRQRPWPRDIWDTVTVTVHYHKREQPITLPIFSHPAQFSDEFITIITTSSSFSFSFSFTTHLPTHLSIYRWLKLWVLKVLVEMGDIVVPTHTYQTFVCISLCLCISLSLQFDLQWMRRILDILTIAVLLLPDDCNCPRATLPALLFSSTTVTILRHFCSPIRWSLSCITAPPQPTSTLSYLSVNCKKAWMSNIAM